MLKAERKKISSCGLYEIILYKKWKLWKQITDYSTQECY